MLQTLLQTCKMYMDDKKFSTVYNDIILHADTCCQNMDDKSSQPYYV